MQMPDALIPIDDAPRTEVDGFVQIFTNPPEIDEDDPFADPSIRLFWNEEVEGNGVILYVYKGRRTWVTSSLSKIPFTALKKALTATVDYDHLEQVYLIRGARDYPLSDTEAKTLLVMLNNRFKDTSVSSRINYASAPQISEKSQKIIEDAFEDIVEALIASGLDLTKPEAAEPVEGQELFSGIDEVVLNGVRVTVQTKLKNENNPSEGIGFISVKASVDSTGDSLLYSSSGNVTTTGDDEN